MVSGPQNTDKRICSRKLGPAEPTQDHWLTIHAKCCDPREVSPFICVFLRGLLASQFSSLTPLVWTAEGLSIDPFGFTAVTQGAWEAQPLSVRQGANEVTSAEASDSLWRTDCSHLQTTPEGRQPMCGCHPVPGHCFLTTWKSRLGLRPGTSPTPWRQAAANGSPHKLVH